MIAYADAGYYQIQYLLGREPVIPLSEFDFWAKAASERINWRKVTLDDVPDYLKDCTCSVAEILYGASAAKGTPDMPAKRSESVGQYSVSYADSTRTASELNAAVGEAIMGYLSGTELHNLFVYRGR